MSASDQWICDGCHKELGSRLVYPFICGCGSTSASKTEVARYGVMVDPKTAEAMDRAGTK